MIKVKTTDSFEKLGKKYREAIKSLEDSGPTFKKIAVLLDRFVQKNFKSEGGKVGKWKKLKAGGRKKKGKPLDTTAVILQDTGRLRISFRPFTMKNGAGIGSDLPYARPHNEGKGALPKRRMLPLEREINKEVREVLNKYVIAGLKNV